MANVTIDNDKKMNIVVVTLVIILNDSNTPLTIVIILSSFIKYLK